jgi:hypothetical protein
VAEGAASGAGEDGGAAAVAAGGRAGPADATGEFARAATAGRFFLRCLFPASAGAARNSTKTGFGANLGEFGSWRRVMVCDR